MKQPHNRGHAAAAKQQHAGDRQDCHDDDDEVAFWLRFIDWWQCSEQRPATDRMLQALANARQRQALQAAPARRRQTGKPTAH